MNGKYINKNNTWRNCTSQVWSTSRVLSPQNTTSPAGGWDIPPAALWAVPSCAGRSRSLFYSCWIQHVLLLNQPILLRNNVFPKKVPFIQPKVQGTTRGLTCRLTIGVRMAAGAVQVDLKPHRWDWWSLTAWCLRRVDVFPCLSQTGAHRQSYSTKTSLGDRRGEAQQCWSCHPTTAPSPPNTANPRGQPEIDSEKEPRKWFSVWKNLFRGAKFTPCNLVKWKFSNSLVVVYTWYRGRKFLTVEGSLS